MKITLFRDLPTERWPSMERYADALGDALRAQGYDATDYVAARPLPGLSGIADTLGNYLWRTLIYPPLARFHQGEINHIIDHSYAHLLGALDPRRTVVTCHDVAPLAQGRQGSGVARRLWQHSFRAMMRAAYIITVSAFTRDELLVCCDYPPERVVAIHNGVDASFFAPAPPDQVAALRRRVAPRQGQRIALHVGSCQPRKNIETLLNALARLDDVDWLFAQVGGRFSAEQRGLIEELGLEERIIQPGPVSEDELRLWYAAADAFAFPSLYEGFGLPVAEAMAAGLPVVCARAASLPEITALPDAPPAALLVDPHDEAALARALAQALADEPQRQELIARGRVRAHQLTWAATARRTAAVYEQMRT